MDLLVAAEPVLWLSDGPVANVDYPRTLAFILEHNLDPVAVAIVQQHLAHHPELAADVAAHRLLLRALAPPLSSGASSRRWSAGSLATCLPVNACS